MAQVGRQSVPPRWYVGGEREVYETGDGGGLSAVGIPLQLVWHQRQRRQRLQSRAGAGSGVECCRGREIGTRRSDGIEAAADRGVGRRQTRAEISERRAAVAAFAMAGWSAVCALCDLRLSGQR